MRVFAFRVRHLGGKELCVNCESLRGPSNAIPVRACCKCGRGTASADCNEKWVPVPVPVESAKRHPTELNFSLMHIGSLDQQTAFKRLTRSREYTLKLFFLHIFFI